MRVLILSHLYPSVIKPHNGIFVHEQVKELIRLGLDITVVSPVKSAPFPLNKLKGKWKEFAQIPDFDEYEGINVYYPRYISLPRNILFEHTGDSMYSGIQKLVKKVHADKPFDIIHAHVALPDGVAALKLSKMLKIPYILTIHGQDFQKTIYMNDKCKDKVVSALDSAAEVILVSNKLKRIQENELSGYKVNVIPNGVSSEYLKPTEHPKTPYKFFNTEGPKLLSVSNLYYEKGIQVNIEAVKQLCGLFPDLEYIIAGDGPERAQLENLVKENGLEKHIVFTGALSPDKVKSIMEECDVFSMPSFNEAFGIVYVEAMASGKPVIGCVGEGPEHFIDHGKNGYLVEKRNSDSLQNILKSLFSNHDLRKHIGEEARKTVINGYTWEQAARQISNIYKKTLD